MSTTNLDAVRAAAKARAITLAAGAAHVVAHAPGVEARAITIVPESGLVKAVSRHLARPEVPPPTVPLPIAAKVTADSPPAPAKLQQFNVRLTSEAKARLHGAALACHVSDQEFLERWAMTLPAPAVPKMPWEV